MNQRSPQTKWLRFDLREMLALLVAFGVLYWAAIPRMPDAPQVTPTQAAKLVANEEVETVNVRVV